ncbi:MAG: hypothetical protein AAFZ49_09620 [Cyanobacteria bacterium J06659_2]
MGQLVQIRISACPYPDYGTLPGTVQTISPDIVNPQATAMTVASSASLGEQSGHFEVTA